jgi:hypothetical protein
MERGSLLIKYPESLLSWCCAENLAEGLTLCPRRFIYMAKFNVSEGR